MQHTTCRQHMFLTQQSTVPETRKGNFSHQSLPPLHHILGSNHYTDMPISSTPFWYLMMLVLIKRPLLSMTMPVSKQAPFEFLRHYTLNILSTFIYFVFISLLRHGLVQWMHQHSEMTFLASLIPLMLHGLTLWM